MKFIVCSLVMAFASGVAAQPASIVLQNALALSIPGSSMGRSIFHTDAVELALVNGTWQPPKAGDIVKDAGGKEHKWVSVQAGEGGSIGHPGSRSGYVYWEVESESERVALLEAAGYLLAYVNGEPRVGDPYGAGYVRMPVFLRRGANSLLFVYSRGAMAAQLLEAEGEVAFNTDDVTLPDLTRGETEPAWASVLVLNQTTARMEGMTLTATRPDGIALATTLPALGALESRKVPFQLPPAAEEDAASIHVALTITRGEQEVAAATVKVSVSEAGKLHKRTFISTIDNSAQYYAVLPPIPHVDDPRPPALVLALHGAAVEGRGQAASYSAKSWATIVSPTNRRPFGFDWEDWGRLDALEVLEHAAANYATDPSRVYVTGHSMGGHGTWHLGATFPGRFAAIGPSAGWISFLSYGSATPYEQGSPIERIFARASSPSDTLGLIQNFAQEGIYILHGDADDNVPVKEARQMREQLAKFHKDLHYHEQPGAGHWWGSKLHSGSECVDWRPLFDLFARRTLPAAPYQVDFVTACPGVSADNHWLRIEAQQNDLEFSSASILQDPGPRKFKGTTKNVSRLSLSLSCVHPGSKATVELDGDRIEVLTTDSSDRITLRRREGKWEASEPAPANEKGPHRYGLFRDAFKNHVRLVVGTAGTPEENAWAFAKARYDAEVFWVRGNASFEIVTDRELQADKAGGDGNVVLYGNADTNAAWADLLGQSPVQVRRGQVAVGSKVFEGDDQLALFIRPRPGSDVASVGAIAPTGLPASRLANRIPYFISGVGLPDLTVLSVEMLAKEGLGGVRAAGYFGNDWSIENGDIVFGDAD